MPKPDLSIDFCGIKMKNPVTVASGTFGYGEEFEKYFDLNELGAIITKSVTVKAREGNPQPRVVETPYGLINSIGLQNKGIDYFVEHNLPHLQKFNTPVIANIAGKSKEEFAQLAKILDGQDVVKGFEVNVSCPNVAGGLDFSTDPNATCAVTEAVKAATRKPVIIKLSPNVTNIVTIAKAAVKSGADGLSLINTILGLGFVDHPPVPGRGKPKFLIGGLSGPAVKPVALRLIYQVRQEVDVPILGMGGIASAADAVEFFTAGASAVAVGTASFVNPRAAVDVIAGLREFAAKNNLNDLRSLGLK